VHACFATVDESELRADEALVEVHAFSTSRAACSCWGVRLAALRAARQTANPSQREHVCRR